jgi:hypothetical protein
LKARREIVMHDEASKLRAALLRELEEATARSE